MSDVRGLRRQAGVLLDSYSAGLIGVSIALFAAVLRVVQIGSTGLDLDEVFSLWMSEKSPSQILQGILFERADSTPPLFYILMHFFTALGHDLFQVRVISIIAGAITVWLAFLLANYLFDVRVATLSAFLVAIAPFHLEYSREARGYMVASVFVLASLYFYARILFSGGNRWIWMGLILASAAAMYTHYVVIVVLLFENLFLAFLFLRRHLPMGMAGKWIFGQIALVVILSPLSLAFFSHAGADGGQEWIAKPGLQSLVKTLILFGTGDPSSGPSRFTIERGLSLLVIAAIAVLGILVVARRKQHAVDDNQMERIAFLAGAFAVPLALTFVISQVRPLYLDKYFIFLLPLMLTLLAWVLLRSKYVLVTTASLICLVALTLMAMYTYYTVPTHEQWREAVSYFKPGLQAGDVVVVTPGFYLRSAAYYLDNKLPDNGHAFSKVPAATLDNGNYAPLTLANQADSSQSEDAVLVKAQRVWLLSGYEPLDRPGETQSVLSTLARDFHQVNTTDFVGIKVSLLQRSEGDDE